MKEAMSLFATNSLIKAQKLIPAMLKFRLSLVLPINFLSLSISSSVWLGRGFYHRWSQILYQVSVI